MEWIEFAAKILFALVILWFVRTWLIAWQESGKKEKKDKLDPMDRGW